jgi:hypothetical protein
MRDTSDLSDLNIDDMSNSNDMFLVQVEVLEYVLPILHPRIVHAFARCGIFEDLFRGK